MGKGKLKVEAMYYRVVEKDDVDDDTILMKKIHGKAWRP